MARQLRKRSVVTLVPERTFPTIRPELLASSVIGLSMSFLATAGITGAYALSQAFSTEPNKSRRIAVFGLRCLRNVGVPSMATWMFIGYGVSRPVRLPVAPAALSAATCPALSLHHQPPNE